MKKDREKKKVLFSIVVPVYNVEKYLGKCIQSILDQSYSDFELVLIDDGSTDESLNICKYYADLDSRVVVYSKENGGLLSTRKTGARVATGQYIICIDSDDYIKEGYLERVAKDVQSEADILMYGYDTVDDSGNLLSVHFDGIPEGKYTFENKNVIFDSFMYSDKLEKLNMGTISFSLWSKVFKREYYVENQVGILEGISFGEDLAVTVLALRQAQTIQVQHYSGYCYRINPKSITHTINLDTLQSCEKLIPILREQQINEEKISAYAFQVLFAFLRSVAKNSKKFSEFKEKDRDSMSYQIIWESAIRVPKYMLSTKDLLKLLIVKCQCFFMKYYLLKID